MSLQDVSPAVSFLAFAVLWCGICYLLATLSGWGSLSKSYRLSDSFEGEKWRFRSAQFRHFVGYNNALTLGANNYGLYLAVLFPFRVGHPPLLIPWEDVRKAQRGALNLMSTPLVLGGRSPVRVSVSARLVAKFEEIAGRPIETAV